MKKKNKKLILIIVIPILALSLAALCFFYPEISEYLCEKSGAKWYGYVPEGRCVTADECYKNQNCLPTKFQGHEKCTQLPEKAQKKTVYFELGQPFRLEGGYEYFYGGLDYSNIRIKFEDDKLVSKDCGKLQ